MEILENKAQWLTTYQEGWLAHAQKTGSANWKLYRHPRNRQTPGTSGITLSESRLMVISSAGGYLPESQQPFDAASLYGDYTIRTFPAATPLSALDYAHDHFNQTMIRQDAQVALPLRYLEEMVAANELGALAPSVVSFMGYQPNSARVVNEMIPQIVAQAKSEEIDAALLAPVWPICHQSVGLIARALEMNGIATVVIAWNGGRIRLVSAPRTLITRLERGVVFGMPNQEAQQRETLQAALRLLEEDAPLKPVYFE